MLSSPKQHTESHSNIVVSSALHRVMPSLTLHKVIVKVVNVYLSPTTRRDANQKLYVIISDAFPFCAAVEQKNV